MAAAGGRGGRRAEQAIVARGEPIDAKDVDRIVVRATPHLRRAAESIRKLRVPPGEAAKVKPVLKAIDRLAGLVEYGKAVVNGLEPPLRASDEASDYYFALYDTSEFARNAAETARYTPAAMREINTRFVRHGRRERKAYRALVRALRRVPGNKGVAKKPRDPVS